MLKSLKKNIRIEESKGSVAFVQDSEDYRKKTKIDFWYNAI